MKKYYNFNYYVLEHMKQLNLTSKEVVTLFYLRYLFETNQEVNMEKIAESTGLSLIDISQLVESLLEKELINVKFNDGKIHYDTNQVFQLLEKKSEKNVSTIFKKIETGFNRIISQKEVEKINDLIQTYDLKLVEYALRETLLQEANSLAYMEKILMNWKKANYTAEDYENGKTTFE